MEKILIVIFVFVMQFTFAQSLLPVYEGKVKPKFELVWEIGGEDSSEELLLNHPEHLRLDKNGNLYFVESREAIIKKVDSNGKYVKTIGRKGEGPGEFKNCRCFIFDDKNNYYVLDSRLKRISHFSSDDKFVKSYSYKDYLINITALSEFNFAVHYYEYNVINNYAYRKHIHTITDNKFITNKYLDSLNIKTSKRKVLKDRILTLQIGFGPTSDLIALNNGKIFSTNSDNYIVKLYSEEGKIIKENNYGEKKQKVSEREKEKYISVFMNDPNTKGFRDMIEINDYKPFYKFIIQDSEGYILVRTNEDDENVNYDIFSSDGEFIKKTELPEKYFNYNSLVSGNHIYTIEKNKDHLIVIRKYKIIL